MDYVINRIIDIEKEARRITEEANIKKEKMPQELEKEIALADAQIKSKYEKNLADYKDKSNNENKAVIDDMNRLYQGKIVFLKSSFEKHSRKWESELFNEIINR